MNFFKFSCKSKLLSVAACAILFSSASCRAEGVVEGAKDAGQAVGQGVRTIATAGKEVGLSVADTAVEVGKEIGKKAVVVGKTVGQVAKEGSKALVRGIKGDPS